MTRGMKTALKGLLADAYRDWLATVKEQGGTCSDFETWSVQHLDHATMQVFVTALIRSEAKQEFHRHKDDVGIEDAAGQQYMFPNIEREIPSHFTRYGEDEQYENMRRVPTYYATAEHARHTAEIKKRQADDMRRAANDAAELADEILDACGGNLLEPIRNHVVRKS